MPTLPMTPQRKAAMIVQMLVCEGQKFDLTSLPIPMQKHITEEIGGLTLQDKTTVANVANEFINELDNIGMTPLGGLENVLSTLGDYISPDLVQKLRADLANAKINEPWPIIVELDVEEIVSLMERQSPQISAIVLSKLPVSKAAEVLGKLPGNRARNITFSVSQTESISPEVVKRIGTALANEYCVTTTVAFDKAPVQRIGDILNSTTTATRDLMLEGLSEQDEQLANDVKKAIFTFADIPTRITPVDVSAAIRGVESETLNTAIAGAMSSEGTLAEAAEFILSNISQRMAEQIREEVEELGAVKASVADLAMNTVSSSILQMASDGSLKFINIDEEDEEE